jgi:hypothetical protein
MPAKTKTASKTSTPSAKPQGKVTKATSTETHPGDFYNEDLSDIDTSFPLLREDVYECEFASATQEPSKDGDKQFLHFVFKTAQPGKNPEGQNVSAGYTLHKRINLTESEDRDQAMIRRDIARIVKDGFGARRVADLRPGDRVLIRVRNSRERTEEKTGRTYSASSEPASFKPVS